MQLQGQISGTTPFSSHDKNEKKEKIASALTRQRPTVSEVPIQLECGGALNF
jgi:hypothetical protein